MQVVGFEWHSPTIYHLRSFNLSDAEYSNKRKIATDVAFDYLTIPTRFRRKGKEVVTWPTKCCSPRLRRRTRAAFTALSSTTSSIEPVMLFGRSVADEDVATPAATDRLIKHEVLAATKEL